MLRVLPTLGRHHAFARWNLVRGRRSGVATTVEPVADRVAERGAEEGGEQHDQQDGGQHVPGHSGFQAFFGLVSRVVPGVFTHLEAVRIVVDPGLSLRDRGVRRCQGRGSPVQVGLRGREPLFGGRALAEAVVAPTLRQGDLHAVDGNHGGFGRQVFGLGRGPAVGLQAGDGAFHGLAVGPRHRDGDETRGRGDLQFDGVAGLLPDVRVRLGAARGDGQDGADDGESGSELLEHAHGRLLSL